MYVIVDSTSGEVLAEYVHLAAATAAIAHMPAQYVIRLVDDSQARATRSARQALRAAGWPAQAGRQAPPAQAGEPPEKDLFS